jgi:hypothetical protein
MVGNFFDGFFLGLIWAIVNNKFGEILINFFFGTHTHTHAYVCIYVCIYSYINWCVYF